MSPKKKEVKEEVDFSQFDIEQLLADEGIEFRNPEKAVGGWLPLEAFDDDSYDSKTPAGWLRKKFDGKHVKAKGLWKDRDALCYWREIYITRYFPKSRRYEGVFRHINQKAKLPRIYILFDDEDPRHFVTRFKNSYQDRIYADSLIKYNYYIENMPTHEIPDLDHDKVSRILTLTQNTKALRGKSSTDTSLLNEIDFEFKKTMNKIIFDKHLKEKGSSNGLITGSLTLPEDPPKKQTPYFGMITIPEHDYPTTFSQFNAATLLSANEVILALHEIKKECNDVMTRDIYNPNINKSMRIEDFKQIQNSSISQTSYYLRETWVNKVKDIIKGNFNNIDNDWYNISETNREIYEVGKLKKFLTQVKFVMQDTLLHLTRESIHRFKDAILSFLPLKCEVQDINQIVNKFITDEEQAEIDEDPFATSKDPIPLFTIDLILEDGSLEPQYSVDPGDVVSTIMQIFDSGIESLQEILQIEQKLLPHLFKKESHSMFLKATNRPKTEPTPIDIEDKTQLEDENLWVWEAYKKLRSELMKAIYPMDDFISCEFLKSMKNTEYKLNVDAYIKEKDPDAEEGDPPEIDELKKDVVYHIEQENKLKDEIPESVIVSMFQINCREFREQLCKKHSDIAKLEIEIIAKRAKIHTEELLKKFEEMHGEIQTKPDDIEQLTAIREYMTKCEGELEKLKGEIKECMKVYDILDEFNFKFDNEDDYKKKCQVLKSPKDTIDIIERQSLYLDKTQEKLIAQMYGDQTNFEAEIAQLETTISTLSQYQDINQHEEVAEIVKTLDKKMKDAHSKSKKFANRERLMGLNETDYSRLQQLNKEYEPFFNLWTTSDDWFKNHNSWMNDPWEQLNAPDMEENVTNSIKTINKVIRYFREKEQPSILKIGETIKNDLDKFKPLVPLALALRKDGMKDRHWEQLSKEVGFEVKPTEDFTFQHIKDLNLIEYVAICEDIGEKASKEFTIELELAKMKEEWNAIEFFLIPFKKSETYTATGFDDALNCLDEQNVKTQAMQFSPFKKPFEEEIKEWYDLLLLMTDILEEWIKCQGQWAYLQPIFDSPDIMKQLPAENKKFKSVDGKWRNVMKKCKENPNVLHICSDPQLKEDFIECNEDLDVVQKGLKDYLESKRAVFARFYFLSNDDLLLILSQTKDVQNVRPHLRKVFENLADVHFNPDNTISAMFSSEKERIEFVEDVDPRDKGVEYWMGDVEDMMIKSVRHVLLTSVEDYTERARTEWIKRHPGQCVLNGSQVHWTKEVEDSFQKGPTGVAEYFKKLGDQLLDTVQLVRTKLNKLQSIALGALIVIDVHAKEVVETLVKEKIDDVNTFEWISQLRYYWENDDCRVKMVQTDFPYGYEYLGNTLRLVITPLTDRCYITLMGALKLHMGGAPAGPAGTGKTESTKDLAKALAKQCVVFNCSDGMDYKMIGTFFKGLSSAGAWCCFDEFNRINIEVLSVIAQQLLTLFNAKAEGIPELIFEESRILLKPTFSVFITMNPGYAGRTELPDNLQALFRPMAMMVPDYALIGQIMLYSFGFKEAKTLAEKMVTTFKLSSEQLSSQKHYDYGMRAVRSVINAAGLLKRADQEMNEDKLLLRALRDVNVPKFLKHDLPLFENIISDLFPGVQRPQIDYGALVPQIHESCKHFNLQPEKIFIEKVMQLYDTILVRHGLMLVGPTGGGKTCNYRVLQHTMTQLQEDENFAKVNTVIINPKSVTMGQLYGEVDPQTTEWIDGVLAKKIEICASDESPERHWVMFDGPVDALWIESMNTVLDDNKKLCLNSGQIIPLTDRMTMMFEVEDLEVASPATVSRCGMVYMEPVALGTDCLFKSWYNTFPPPFKLSDKLSSKIQEYIETYANEMLDFVRRNCDEPVKTMDNNVCQSL